MIVSHLQLNLIEIRRLHPRSVILCLFPGDSRKSQPLRTRQRDDMHLARGRTGADYLFSTITQAHPKLLGASNKFSLHKRQTLPIEELAETTSVRVLCQVKVPSFLDVAFTPRTRWFMSMVATHGSDTIISREK